MKINPISGVANVATNNTAVPLYRAAVGPGEILQVSRIIFQADPANTVAALIGFNGAARWSLAATGWPLELVASDNDYFNLLDFIVNAGTAGTKVNFIAIPCLR